MPLDLAIDAALASRARLAALVVEDLTVRETEPGLTLAIEDLGRDLRQRFSGVASGAVPGVEDARRLYKTLGLDPTKTRPSNESLLRRVLKGEGLYRINTLVDAINLCSLAEQLPYGLYDLAQMAPPVVLRLGLPGEGYEGIRKGVVRVADRPTLVDSRGPFGNPTSDSLRTSITLATRSALMIVYAPRALTDARLASVAARTLATVTRHNGGRLVEQRLLPDQD